MSNPPSSALAYESLLAEMLAIPDEHLAGMQLDVTAAITAVARLLSTLRNLGPTLEATWHGLDFEQLDRLELCTLALHHAESRFRRLPDDGVCALIRQKAATLFLQAYDDLQYAMQQLLDPEPPCPLDGVDPSSTSAEDSGDREGEGDGDREDEDEDEPAPITLVSLRPDDRAVA
jgi:hypothetical protein